MKHKTVSLHIGIATAPLLCGVRVRLAAGTSILELTGGEIQKFNIDCLVWPKETMLTYVLPVSFTSCDH